VTTFKPVVADISQRMADWDRAVAAVIGLAEMQS